MPVIAIFVFSGSPREQPGPGSRALHLAGLCSASRVLEFDHLADHAPAVQLRQVDGRAYTHGGPIGGRHLRNHWVIDLEERSIQDDLRKQLDQYHEQHQLRGRHNGRYQQAQGDTRQHAQVEGDEQLQLGTIPKDRTRNIQVYPEQPQDQQHAEHVKHRHAAQDK